MKTLVIAFVAFCTLSLVSCGGGTPSVCDCVKNAEKGAQADKTIAEKCLKLTEGKSPEEIAKMGEEALKCK
jgi:hypothetical protein